MHDGCKSKSPLPGIEPGSPGWQAGILTTILQRPTLLRVENLTPTNLCDLGFGLSKVNGQRANNRSSQRHSLNTTWSSNEKPERHPGRPAVGVLRLQKKQEVQRRKARKVTFGKMCWSLCWICFRKQCWELFFKFKQQPCIQGWWLCVAKPSIPCFKFEIVEIEKVGNSIYF